MGCEEPFVFVLRISSNKDWGPPEERRVWCEEPFVFVYLNILPASNIISLYHRAGWSKNLSKSMHLMARGATRPGPARVVVRPRPGGATCHRVHSTTGFFSAVFFRLEYPLRRIFWRRRTGAWRSDGPI